MTYTFKMSRRLASNHQWRALVFAALTTVAGCVAGAGMDPVLVQGSGTLTLTASGLAAHGKPQAILIGPNGFQQEITDAGQVSGLPLGTYQVRFLPTMVDGDRWAPNRDLETILLASPNQPISLSIRYVLSSGILEIRPEGVPAGTDPVVHLAGPAGYSRDVVGAAAVRGLAPGTYTLTATQGSFGAAVYRPTTAVSQVEIVSSPTPVPAVIPYWRAVGALDVAVTGLPSGAVAHYDITGPGNYHAARTGAARLTALDPGTYVITASPVPFEGNTWAPMTTLVPVAVDTGTVTVAIGHEIATGTLALEVEGLPVGVSAPLVNISGPAGFTQNLSASQQWVGVAPGTYHATASAFSNGSRRYVPDSPDQNIPVAPGTSPSRGKVKYIELKGSLTISFGGLPSGAAGRVVVIGAGFADTVLATSTLPDLSAGTYTLAASSVTVGGTVYVPTPSSQAAIIVAGESVSKSVTWAAAAPTTGSLTVNLSGLPSGAAGAVAISGPSGFSQTITATTTLNGLAPGGYTIAAANVTSGGSTHQPTPVMQTATVTAGATTSKSITYEVASPTTGSLTVALSGLPGSAAGAIAVNGPNGFIQTLTATTTLNGLAPGGYTIAAANVTSGGATYQPTPVMQTATVTAGAAASLSIAYAITAPTTGSLTVTIAGLPSGAAASVAVNGPNGYSQTLTTASTATLTDLSPGSYVVVPANVAGEGSTYQPRYATQTATVTSGANTPIWVSYVTASATTGSLTVTLSGLPSGAAGAVAIGGPGGFSQTLTATTTLTGIAAGTYTVAAANVTSGGVTYQPALATQTATVTAGATANTSVAYAPSAPTTGSLAVTLSGLPGGTAGAIAVNGPNGFSQTLTGSATLNALAPGTYAIAAANVTSGGATYQPTPATQSASVTAGGTIGKVVTYAVQAGPVTITVDTTTRFQTMNGWEAHTQSGQDSPGFAGWQQRLMDLAANDLGINRVRLEVRSGAENPVDSKAAYQAGALTYAQYKATWFTPVNDNSNSNSINASGFQFSELDESVDLVVEPLRQRLAARGEHLYVNLNYVSFGGATFHTSNPAEYAELMLATFQHLQSRYGWVPDAIEVILEPDNGTGWSGTQIGQAIVATGTRLAAAGFHPDFIGPSTMSMAQAVPYTNQIIAVPGALTYLKEISYHRYTNTWTGNLTAIRDKANQYGLRTAMLEHIGSGVEDLYLDLTLANASAWQQFALAYPTQDTGGHYYGITNGSPVIASRTVALRQYFRYVRFGAQRVAATSISSGVRPVAFTNPGDGMAVVLHVDVAGTYSVAGLRPGNYGVEMTTGAGTQLTLPNVTAIGNHPVSVAPGQTGVLTLYRLP